MGNDSGRGVIGQEDSQDLTGMIGIENYIQLQAGSAS
jgi:hypothetical protein